MKNRSKPFAVAFSCMALVCGSALAHGVDRGDGRNSGNDGTAYDRTTRAFVPAPVPTAGGNSAEPDRTGYDRYGEYASSPHDQRWTPIPRTGAPLPSAGGNSAEPDKTGMQRPMDRAAEYRSDGGREARHDAGMRRHSADRDGHARWHRSEGMSSRYERRTSFDSFGYDGPSIGDPFPTAGGNSAEPERTGKLS